MEGSFPEPGISGLGGFFYHHEFCESGELFLGIKNISAAPDNNP